MRHTESMTRGQLCELLGGPFDGDTGMLTVLADDLWVFGCGDSINCPFNGVHWYTDLRMIPTDFEPVRYRLQPEEKTIRTYLFAELEDPALLVQLAQLASA